MFEKVKAIFEVLEAGKMLKNPAAWKNGQIAANSGIITILIVTRIFLPTEMQLSDETLSNIGLIIGSLGALVNTYLTMATTEKVGVKKSCKEE